MQTRPKFIALAILLLVAIIFLVIGMGLKKGIGYGTVIIQYKGSTDNLSLKFNNKVVEPVSPFNYHLAGGNYEFSATSPGYKPFSTGFSLTNGQTVYINLALQLVSDNTITGAQQLGISGVQLTNVEYFDGSTWAVCNIVQNNDNAVVVAKFNLSSQQWSIVLGPGSSFPEASLVTMPLDVQNYLTEKGYAYNAIF